MRTAGGTALAAVLSLAACGHHDGGGPSEEPCPEGRVRSAGMCFVQLDDCPLDAVPIPGGGCRVVGAPKTECPGGTMAGIEGCMPILPSAPCPLGTVAFLGESACRPLLDCGSDPFGDPPSDRPLVFVDASFTGTSDGTRARPFTSIGAALAATTAEPRIAIAKGTYAEALAIAKPVHLWGRCPDLVDIRGGAEIALSASARVDVHGVSLSGQRGLWIHGGKGHSVDHVRIHDTSKIGLQVDDVDLVAHDLLIERASLDGVFVNGSNVTLERVAIRDVRQDAAGDQGYPIEAEPHAGRAPTLAVRDAILERGFDAAIELYGTHADLTRIVVRAISPRASDKSGGGGLDLRKDGVASEVTIADSWIDGAHFAALGATDSKLTVERVLVRDTLDDDRGGGHGLALYARRSEIAVRDSSFLRSVWIGLDLDGTNGTIERTIVSEIAAGGSPATATGILARPDGGPSTLTLRDSVVASVHGGGGIAVLGGTLDAQGCSIASAEAIGASGAFGDGISVITSTGSLRASLVRGSARAAVSAFGGALSVIDSAFRCNGIDLDYESWMGTAPDLTAGEGNVCGCETKESCHAQSTGLTPIDVH